MTPELGKSFDTNASDMADHNLSLVLLSKQHLEGDNQKITIRGLVRVSGEVDPNGKGLDRSQLYRDEGLLAFAASFCPPAPAKSRRRTRAPTHVKRLNRLQLAQKITQACRTSQQLEAAAAHLRGELGEASAILSDMDALVQCRSRQGRVWRAILLIRAGPKTQHDEKRCPRPKNKEVNTLDKLTTSLSLLCKKGIAVTPSILAEAADVHVSTAERHLVLYRASNHEDKASSDSIAPYSALMRSSHRELAEGLDLERRYIRMLRRIITVAGKRQVARLEAKLLENLHAPQAEQSRPHVGFNLASPFLQAAHGQCPANDDG